MERIAKKLGTEIAMILFIVLFFHCEEWIEGLAGISSGWEADMVTIFSENIFHGLCSMERDISIVINACASLILFNVLYGGYIYDELHGTGVYYFIRYEMRKKWFVQKVLKLLCNAVVFHLVYVGLQYVLALIQSGEIVNLDNVGMMISYTMYLTVLCFMLSMIINIFSVICGRVIAFIVGYLLLIVMRGLVLAVGNVSVLVTNLEIKAFIPINVTLNGEGCFTADTWFSLLFTVILCCILIVVCYHIIQKDNIGLLIEETHI